MSTGKGITMGEPARQIKITYPFVATPTDIADKLIRYPLPPSQRQVLDWIIRQTFGFHRQHVERDLSRIAAATCLDKPGICRALRHLIADGVVLQDGRRLSVNADLGGWGNPDRAGVDIGNSDNFGETIPFIEKKKENNLPAVSSHETFFQKIKRRVSGQNGAVKEALSRVPEEHRGRSAGIVRRYIKRRGAGYVHRAIDYCLFREPKNFSAYLACALNEGWGEQWHQQRQQAAEMDARRAEQAQRQQAEMEATKKAIEESNQAFEARRERVFSMPPDELERMEAEFVGGLAGLRLKRYKKRGLKAVELEFVEYCEQRKTKNG